MTKSALIEALAEALNAEINDTPWDSLTERGQQTWRRIADGVLPVFVEFAERWLLARADWDGPDLLRAWQDEMTEPIRERGRRGGA